MDCKPLRADSLNASPGVATPDTFGIGGGSERKREASEIVRKSGELIQRDAAQGPGKTAVNVAELAVDFSHRIGPQVLRAKGDRRSVPCSPSDTAATQAPAAWRRAGGWTAVGLASALELTTSELPREAERQTDLRNLPECCLIERLDGCAVNGDPAHRLPNTSNISFEGVEGAALLASSRR